MLAEEYRQIPKDNLSAKEEMVGLLRFMEKKERNILLRHNQSLELLKQKALTLYSQTTKRINEKLERYDLTTETLKVRKGHNKQATDSLKYIKLDLVDVEKMVPEVIAIEKETAARLQELATFKCEEIKKWCEKAKLN